MLFQATYIYIYIYELLISAYISMCFLFLSDLHQRVVVHSVNDFSGDLECTLVEIGDSGVAVLVRAAGIEGASSSCRDANN